MVLEVLFSFTVLAAVLFLSAVVVASYVGATIALRRFFGEEGRKAV